MTGRAESRQGRGSRRRCRRPCLIVSNSPCLTISSHTRVTLTNDSVLRLAEELLVENRRHPERFVRDREVGEHHGVFDNDPHGVTLAVRVVEAATCLLERRGRVGVEEVVPGIIEPGLCDPEVGRAGYDGSNGATLVDSLSGTKLKG